MINQEFRENIQSCSNVNFEKKILWLHVLNPRPLQTIQNLCDWIFSHGYSVFLTYRHPVKSVTLLSYKFNGTYDTAHWTLTARSEPISRYNCSSLTKWAVNCFIFYFLFFLKYNSAKSKDACMAKNRAIVYHTSIVKDNVWIKKKMNQS